MTEKRWFIEDDEPLQIIDSKGEYEAVCVLYSEDAYKVMDLLNEQHELILQGFEEIAKANDEKFDYEMKVKDILQKYYDILSKKYAQGKSVTREKSEIKLELLELLADELGVDLE